MPKLEPPVLQPDEPTPVEVLREQGQSPFVIVCDHAGNLLPRALGTLGLTAGDLQAHIAWDIGVRGLAERLSEALDAPLFLQRYSRLVIDCNRPLHAADSIAEHSGGIAIPGNHGVSDGDKAERARVIFSPYHERIQLYLSGRANPFLLIALHSFTPELFGVSRPFHAGVLYNRDTRLAELMLGLLRAYPDLVVGDNQPYAASEATDYSIVAHAERLGAPYVELEVRQDLIATEAGQLAWAERLARLLGIASARFRF